MRYEMTMKEKVFLLALVQDHARGIREAKWTSEELQNELAMAEDLFARLQREIETSV